MENPPFEDVFYFQNGPIQLCSVSLQKGNLEYLSY